MANERTINVTGYGELHAKPDTVRLTLTVERTDADYAAAVRATEQCCAAVTDALVAAGVGEKHIRALSLRTQPRYETSADENGARTRKFAGYAAVRRIRAEFSADAELTGRILDALAGSGAAPEIATEYLLSDREALRGELLARAVKDAKARAKAIAKAAGVKLGDVLSVQNGGHGMPVVRAAAFRADSGAELEPEDMVLTDEVNAVFAIAIFQRGAQSLLLPFLFPFRKRRGNGLDRAV